MKNRWPYYFLKLLLAVMLIGSTSTYTALANTTTTSPATSDYIERFASIYANMDDTQRSDISAARAGLDQLTEEDWISGSDPILPASFTDTYTISDYENGAVALVNDIVSVIYLDNGLHGESLKSHIQTSIDQLRAKYKNDFDNLFGPEVTVDVLLEFLLTIENEAKKKYDSLTTKQKLELFFDLSSFEVIMHGILDNAFDTTSVDLRGKLSGVGLSRDSLIAIGKKLSDKIDSDRYARNALLAAVVSSMGSTQDAPQLDWIDGNIILFIDRKNNRVLFKEGAKIGEALSNVRTNATDIYITDASDNRLTDLTAVIVDGMKLVLTNGTSEAVFTLYTSTIPNLQLTGNTFAEYLGNEHLVVQDVKDGTTAEQLLSTISAGAGTNIYIADRGDLSTSVDPATILDERYRLVAFHDGWEIPYHLRFKLEFALTEGQTAIKEIGHWYIVVNENTTVADVKNAFDVTNSNFQEVRLFQDGTEITDPSALLTETVRFEFDRGYSSYGFHIFVGVGPNQGSESDFGNEGPIKDENGVYNVEIDLVDESGNHVSGVKVFGENDNHIYLPESGQYYLDLSATDKDGQPINLTNSEISFTNIRGFGNEPTYDPQTQLLTTFAGGGGYKDTFEGVLSVGNYQINLRLYVYEGKLGLLSINKPDGKPYDGRLGYSINYKFQNQGQTGSSTDGSAFNGILPIPIQDGYVNLDYAYVVVSPEEIKTGEEPYTNTPFIDLTEQLPSGYGQEFYNLGEAQFQTPTVIGNVYDKNAEPWKDTLIQISNNYVGQDYDIRNVFFSIRNFNGTFYLAPLGNDFDSNASIRIAGFNSENLPIEGEIDFINDSQVDFYSPLEQVRGRLLLPDGTPIPTGDNRDTAISIRGITEPEHKGSAPRNSGDYAFYGLKEGYEYWIEAYFDLGDFDDVAITDSIPLKFKYTDFPGEYTAEDQHGNEVPYTVTSEGVMELDLKASDPVLKGNVTMGGAPITSHLRINILDPVTGERIAGGTAHKSSVPTEQFHNQYGVYLIGGVLPLEGEYTIDVQAPMDTVDYTGDTFNLTLPRNGNFDIALPETNVYGQILLDEAHREKYANNIRRVYVNVFDEHGDYVTNGRVRSDGVFTVGQLQEGRYYAQAFVSAYSTVAQDYMTSDKHAFVVSTSDSKVTFDVPLKKVIGSGTVVDPEGSPISNVWVRIFDENMEEVAFVNTNDTGTFYIPALDEGTYRVKAYSTNGYTDSTFAEMDVTSGSSALNISLSLTNPTISGTVAGAASDVDVLLFGENKNYITFATTESGEYAIGGIEPGNYYLQAIPKQPIEGFTQTGFILVEVTGDSHHVNIVLESSDIQGRVQGPNTEQISRGWVQVYRQDEFITSVKVKSDGSFVIGGLEDNMEYTLIADGSKTKFLPSEKLTVIKGESDEIVLTLKDRAAIKGKVVFSGHPKEKQAIYIYNANKEAVKVVRTNVFGEFHTDLENGSYYMVIETGQQPIIREFTYDGNEIDFETIIIE